MTATAEKCCHGLTRGESEQIEYERLPDSVHATVAEWNYCRDLKAAGRFLAAAREENGRLREALTTARVFVVEPAIVGVQIKGEEFDRLHVAAMIDRALGETK